MTEKLGVSEKEPAFGQKTPTTTTTAGGGGTEKNFTMSA